jgi:hypothetical protein
MEGRRKEANNRDLVDSSRHYEIPRVGTCNRKFASRVYRRPGLEPGYENRPQCRHRNLENPTPE